MGRSLRFTPREEIIKSSLPLQQKWERLEKRERSTARNTLPLILGMKSVHMEQRLTNCEQDQKHCQEYKSI